MKQWNKIKRPFIDFLGRCLKDETSAEIRGYIIELLEVIAGSQQQYREYSLMVLAEYLDDSTDCGIQLRILSVFHREMDLRRLSSKLFRQICNKVMVGDSTVRVEAVGLFGKYIASLEDQ